MKCKICKYEWQSRKENPKQCPKCKRYDYENQLRKKDMYLSKEKFEIARGVKNE